MMTINYFSSLKHGLAIFSGAILLSLLLLSCAGNSAGETPTQQPATPMPTITPSSYPGPSASPVSSDNGTNSYPAPQDITPSTSQEAYPSQTTSDGILLALDKPIKEETTTVTGEGPAGLPITIINITQMGESLGSGVINEEGKFSVTVSPLAVGTRIGLQADVAALGLNQDDIKLGSEARNVPLVGFFFDTALVEN